MMCIFIICQKNAKKDSNWNKKKAELYTKLKEEYPEIQTIVENVNNQNTNVILGNTNITVMGEGKIRDQLGEFTFEISPMSFYQINPVQTVKLYNKAIEVAELQKKIFFVIYIVELEPLVFIFMI